MQRGGEGSRHGSRSYATALTAGNRRTAHSRESRHHRIPARRLDRVHAEPCPCYSDTGLQHRAGVGHRPEAARPLDGANVGPVVYRPASISWLVPNRLDAVLRHCWTIASCRCPREGFSGQPDAFTTATAAPERPAGRRGARQRDFRPYRGRGAARPCVSAAGRRRIASSLRFHQ